MDLLSFNSVCAACCSTDALFKYCVGRCEPDRHGKFEERNRMGDPDSPHLHRICQRCGYEWLEHCLGLRTPGGE